MPTRSHVQTSVTCFLRVVTLVAFVLFGRIAYAYTPLDPEVEELVNSGLRYLEQTANRKTYGVAGKANKPGTGEPVLWGYAHLKAAHDPESPVVKEGLTAALAIVADLGKEEPDEKHSASVYNAGITAMFLAELDKGKYRKELEKVSRYLATAQFRGGGFGYFGWPTGDISQAQYAMLALWTLDRSGIPIDYNGVVKASNWLGRVQDQSGGWPYQANDPNTPGKFAPQTGVTASMALAGGSARLIAGDILRLWGDGLSQNDPRIADLPKAVKIALGDDEVKRPTVPHEPILESIERCQSYLSTNTYDPAKVKPNWPFYQLYTLERYESFREVAFGLPKDPSPAWYNMGVEYVKSSRTASGALGETPGLTPAGQTAFAILFLIRSTQKNDCGGGTGNFGWWVWVAGRYDQNYGQWYAN
jgi:hypothetical protein